MCVADKDNNVVSSNLFLNEGLTSIRVLSSVVLNKKMQQLDGIYKIEFEGKPYVMTQMEAISARQSFPSFDEPRFKTPF
ncbi:hypothetical protein, partial [Acinetobacter baumannii]|uniref:hypothetical protein n=1 Tax=Acinetobacter baumannii TaxID=470 RepID=UPI00294B0A38